MRTDIFRKFCAILDSSGQYHRFTPREYTHRRDAIACFFYLVYEVTYLDKVRYDVDYELVKMIAQKYFNLLTFVFGTYFPELPIWSLIMWM